MEHSFPFFCRKERNVLLCSPCVLHAAVGLSWKRDRKKIERSKAESSKAFYDRNHQITETYGSTHINKRSGGGSGRVGK